MCAVAFLFYVNCLLFLVFAKFVGRVHMLVMFLCCSLLSVTMRLDCVLFHECVLCSVAFSFSQVSIWISDMCYSTVGICLLPLVSVSLIKFVVCVASPPLFSVFAVVSPMSLLVRLLLLQA